MRGKNVTLQSYENQGKEKWEKVRRLQSASKNQPCSNYRVDPALVNVVGHEERWIQGERVQGRIEWYQ